jgi:hypothetical protein
MVGLFAFLWHWLKAHPFIAAMLAILLAAAILALLDLAGRPRR